MPKASKKRSREDEQLHEFIEFCQMSCKRREFDQPILVTVLKYGEEYASTRVRTYNDAIDWLKTQAKSSGFNVRVPVVKNNGKGVEKELVAKLESQFAGCTPTLVA